MTTHFAVEAGKHLSDAIESREGIGELFLNEYDGGEILAGWPSWLREAILAGLVRHLEGEAQAISISVCTHCAGETDTSVQVWFNDRLVTVEVCSECVSTVQRA